MADDRHRTIGEAAQARDDGGVVHAGAIAVQLDPVADQALDVIERVGALGVPSKLDRAPDLVFVALVAVTHFLELLLDPAYLVRHTAARQMQPFQLGQTIAELEL